MGQCCARRSVLPNEDAVTEPPAKSKNLLPWSLPPRISNPLKDGRNPLERDWDYVVVHLKKAINLPSSDWLSSADAWARFKVVHMDGKTSVNGGIEEVNWATFATKSNDANPAWDRKMFMCYATDGGALKKEDMRVKVELFDQQGLVLSNFYSPEVLAQKTVPLPKGLDWEEHDVEVGEGGLLTFAIRVFRERYFSLKDTADLGLSELVLDSSQEENDEEAKASLLFKRIDGNKKAVLWFPGKNDTFMHPHVFKEWEIRGFDFFSIDPRRCGRSKKWMKDEYLSHYSGNFDEYNADINKALAFIKPDGYPTFFAYAHSTGGPVLLNYLMSNLGKDAPFTSYCLNSPFLDFHSTNPIGEFWVENVTQITNLAGTNPYGTPPGQGGGHKLNKWGFKLWALYEFDPNARPLFYYAKTCNGWCSAVTAVHNKLRSTEWKGKVTEKPVLVLTSESDDTLSFDDIVEHSPGIGPNVTMETFKYNAHDVFLSPDFMDSQNALAKMMAFVDKQCKV